MNGANPFSLDKDKTNYWEEIGTSSIDINLKRIVTWTLIFTNAFFVSYFFARLFRLI